MIFFMLIFTRTVTFPEGGPIRKRKTMKLLNYFLNVSPSTFCIIFILSLKNEALIRRRKYRLCDIIKG